MAKTVLQETKTQGPRCIKPLLGSPLLMPQQPKLHKGMGITRHEALGAIGEHPTTVNLMWNFIYLDMSIGTLALALPMLERTSPLHQGLSADRDPVLGLRDNPALGPRPSTGLLYTSRRCYLITCPVPRPCAIQWGYNPRQVDPVLCSRLHRSVGGPGSWDELSTWS